MPLIDFISRLDMTKKRITELEEILVKTSKTAM